MGGLNTSYSFDFDEHESTRPVKRLKTTSESPASRPSRNDTPPNGLYKPPQSAKIYPDRIILTTYPGQSVVNPVELIWGASDPEERGPILVSRSGETLSRRNAIGAHGGSYSIYTAVAIASGDLPVDYRPSLNDIEPTVCFNQQPSWSDPSKIVSLDPFGYDIATYFRKNLENGLNIRPTIAVREGQIRVSELSQPILRGVLPVDGSVVVSDAGDVRVTRCAVDPVWYLPGVASRFGIDEQTLRRALFEHTGGSYPELVTRSDMKVFLPPVGGLMAYIFGPPDRISDPDTKITLRVHNECNGSDVFQWDLCTCRPYLIFGIEQAIKEAQNGGSGIVIFLRKENAALGEAIKHAEQSNHKRCADGFDKISDTNVLSASESNEMRFQTLMPDILHWLGVKKIDRLISMSSIKRDAIESQGIPVLESVPIPDHMIPPDSRVEVNVKACPAHLKSGGIIGQEDLLMPAGLGWRMWEDVVH